VKLWTNHQQTEYITASIHTETRVLFNQSLNAHTTKVNHLPSWCLRVTHPSHITVVVRRVVLIALAAPLVAICKLLYLISKQRNTNLISQLPSSSKVNWYNRHVSRSYYYLKTGSLFVIRKMAPVLKQTVMASSSRRC